jgi:hypothetical protein
MKDVFKLMADRWPSSIVARSELSRFSGGILNPRTMANLDSENRGIPNAFRIGRRVGYNVSDVIDFLRSRYTEVERNTKQGGNS